MLWLHKASTEKRLLIVQHNTVTYMWNIRCYSWCVKHRFTSWPVFLLLLLVLSLPGVNDCNMSSDSRNCIDPGDTATGKRFSFYGVSYIIVCVCVCYNSYHLHCWKYHALFNFLFCMLASYMSANASWLAHDCCPHTVNAQVKMYDYIPARQPHQPRP